MLTIVEDIPFSAPFSANLSGNLCPTEASGPRQYRGLWAAGKRSVAVAMPHHHLLPNSTRKSLPIDRQPHMDARVPVALAPMFRALTEDAVLQLLWPVHVPLLDEEARTMRAQLAHDARASCPSFETQVRDALDSATQTPFRDLRHLS